MKKFMFAILAVCLIAQVSFATQSVADAGSPRQSPYGIKVIDLHTRNTVDSDDTLATTDINLYGPYEMCNDGDAMPTKFIVQGDVITGTTPTASLDYQIIAGKSLADTVSAWTAADTLGATATNQQITIAGAGNSIVFRINNYDGTASQIPGLVRIVIPSASSVYRVKK